MIGDIVYLSENQTCPADLLILDISDVEQTEKLVKNCLAQRDRQCV